MKASIFSLCILAIGLFSFAEPGQTQTLTPAEARVIAKDAYIYGYPLVDNYRIQYSYFVDKAGSEYKGPWNTLVNNARVYTPADKAIQTPNSDTPYSYVGADLRAEPLVISVPEIEKERWYSVQFIDQYTFNFAFVGTRTTGNGAGNFLLAGPNWHGQVPPGIKKVIRSETQFAFVFYRTQLFNPADIENVKKVQAGYKVQTLSQFEGKAPPPPAPVIDFIKPLTNQEERASPQFFDILNYVLQFCPTDPSEVALMARFAKLHVGAGQSFNFKAFPPDIQHAITDGMADAWKDMDAIHKKFALHEISAGDILGSRQSLKNNYLYRMAGTVIGIYGQDKEEAIYTGYILGGDGKPLNGGAHDYVLRFAKGQFPPVNAFWSVTLYKMPESLLFANPLNRYLINSPMLPSLKKDADGGVSIYIQAASPGKEKESNWLPAPQGPFTLAVRLYSPKPQAYNGTWKLPPLEQVR
ncbi:DUF1254 domain-containing protein [Paraburkholderia sacchari]|uniref:DUF1254 domain-containing protein n=1 Tax=Paraburkholderia sacchari TaxID=159450 RepID=UPI001BCF9CA2|nr:DUF1254 domain-containing protein [Paraburkholderia sacchari]